MFSVGLSSGHFGGRGILGVALADAGYCSEANLATETEDRELLIATKKDHKQRTALRDAKPPRGRDLYRLRGKSVEPVFGQMKGCQSADCFSMRGIEPCRGEWKLQAAVHNLQKIHRDSVRKAEKARK